MSALLLVVVHFWTTLVITINLQIPGLIQVAQATSVDQSITNTMSFTVRPHC